MGKNIILKKKKFWSNETTKHSFTLVLEERLFNWKDSGKIVRFLKHSAKISFNRRISAF